jgi:hypothetical protein
VEVYEWPEYLGDDDNVSRQSHVKQAQVVHELEIEEHGDHAVEWGMQRERNDKEDHEHDYERRSDIVSSLNHHPSIVCVVHLLLDSSVHRRLQDTRLDEST